MYDEGVDPNWEYYLETGEDPTDGELSGEEAAELDLHGDMLDIPEFDLRVMAAYGDIKRGISRRNALKKFNLTEKEYTENLHRVLYDD